MKLHPSYIIFVIILWLSIFTQNNQFECPDVNTVSTTKVFMMQWKIIIFYEFCENG